MSYRVFARKYRPRTFEEVVGQEHITRTLQNAICGKRLAQAYLFVGPRGIGKTSTARILAKALNCVKGPTVRPCGDCDPCREIAEGNSLDVLEIDGASNNSVDHVRELRENAAFAPTRGPYKIYIIDEVHMLSTAAFNALLKTLEEPPAHVKFIFATTEAQKVPATITSRCQRFDLRRIPASLIASHLKSIAQLEKVVLDDAAAGAIAKGADGGLRDAESMLDQLVAFCGGRITADDVLAVFGFTARETVANLCGRILRLDTAGALALIGEQSNAGKDLTRLGADLITFLRDLLVHEVEPSAPVESEVSGQSGLVSPEKLLQLVDHFSETEARLRWASDKRLYFDVAIIKAVHILDQASLTDVIDTLTSLRGGGETPILRRRAPLAPNTAPANPVKGDVPVQPAPMVVELAKHVEVSKAPAIIEQPPSSGGASAAEAWAAVSSDFSHQSPFKFGWLSTGRDARLAGSKLAVRFPDTEKHGFESLSKDERKRIEKELSDRLGSEISIECEFIESPAASGEPEPAPVAAIERSEAPVEDRVTSFRRDPLIQKALEIFKAEIQTGSS